MLFRYAFVLLMALTACSFSKTASAIENARSLASYCRSLEKGTTGAGRHVRIPNTKEALLCWG
jgi:hypothetical protein